MEPFFTPLGRTAQQMLAARQPVSLKEAYWRQRLANQGAIRTDNPTLGVKMERKVASGLKSAGVGGHAAGALAGKTMRALNDLTPVGNATMASDGAQQASRGYQSGSVWETLRGGGEVALAALPGAAGRAGKGLFGRGMKEWLGKKPYFHGTPDTTFDPSAIDINMTRNGNYGRGLYVSARPDIASGYAGNHGAVYPLQLADDARTLDLTTPEGRELYKTLDEDALRAQFDVIRAPGESVILNPRSAKSVFER